MHAFFFGLVGNLFRNVKIRQMLKRKMLKDQYEVTNLVHSNVIDDKSVLPNMGISILQRKEL